MLFGFRAFTHRLVATVSLVVAGAAANATVLVFDFQFDVPIFTEAELDPLNQIFTSNSISSVTGTLSYDTADAFFVTTNFTFASNIDGLFDVTPTELAFGNTGNLNQIRWWEINISGVLYTLELTGLDEDDTLPNRWFGGKILGFPDNEFELVAAGGGLQLVPLPGALSMIVAGFGALGAVGWRRRSRSGMGTRT